MAYDVAATERYIRDAARRRGIDPDIAVRVAKSEGLARNTWQSNLSKGGRREPSYGPFQLLVGGEGTGYPGGMGNDFKRATGLDPADPANVNATIDYAMDRASKDGWGAWYGAAKVGVGKRTGIGGSAKPALGGEEPVRMADSGATMSDATSFVPNERMPSSSPTSSPSAASPSPQPAGPPIMIGPEKSNKLHEAMVANAMRQGGSARNGWDAVGALAQVWAGSDAIKKNDAANESELQRAVAAANLDPAYAMAAQLGGTREDLASVLIAQEENRTATARRAEDQAWRQDERNYQRDQDGIANRRADETQAMQRVRLENDGVPSGYRRTTAGGLDAIPGGPADTASEPGFRQATPEEAGQYGSTGGQFGPDGRFYPVNPPSGMSVESDGQGGIRVTQGPGAGNGSGGKVPTNFEADPDNPGGVRPIAGGPGEQLPAEFAGRVGISDSFLGQAPALRQQLLSGAVTGPWDRLQAGNNSSSDQAGVYRQLQSGADALQRLLTGAGMTENEAKVYAERYLPSYTDDAASAVTKLDQMVREIQNVRAASLRGRGGTGATVTPNGPAVGSSGNPVQLDEVVVPGASGGLPADITEEDVAHTMQVHGLTREQVLERLR